MELEIEQLCDLCALAPKQEEHSCHQRILDEIDKITQEIEELEDVVRDLKVTRQQMKNELPSVKQRELELFFINDKQ